MSDERVGRYVDTLPIATLFEAMEAVARELMRYVCDDGCLYPVPPDLLDVMSEFAKAVLAQGDSPNTPHELLVMELARAVSEALRTGCHLWVYESCLLEGSTSGPRWCGAKGHEEHVKSIALTLGNLLSESLGCSAAS